MATICVDNRPYTVKADQSLLSACLGVGLNLPYFCWHPALGSVGACRQCAVKQFRDEKDTRGRLVMACMTPVAEGMLVSIDDKDAVEFRAGIIEGLMQSHPHDCPVCDEGGECHLQDMTVMTGHAYRRYEFDKRTFHNQYLGPLVHHEMNRCIQCYRCVRYYREYAGESDLNAFSMRNQVFFGRSEDGVLKSEFAGNLVEICPTGVFTDKTLHQHYTRKWDLQMAPSVCVHCALGCNITAGERYGTVRRIVNRYNGDVNGYFLCDRGRFGYEFVNRPERIREPLLRRLTDGTPAAATVDEALGHLRTILDSASSVIGIGSPRASLESNFALRSLVGADHFFGGVSEREHRLTRLALEILRHGPARSPSLAEIERCDAALVLGEDVMNLAPRTALALRQGTRLQPMAAARKLGIAEWQDDHVREMAQEQRGPLVIATPNETRLDSIAAGTMRGDPDDIARFGFAVAQAISQELQAGAGISTAPETDLADRTAHALLAAERPLVVCGVSLGSEAILHAAANVAWALAKKNPHAAISLIFPEANSLGLAMLEARGGMEEAARAIHEGSADTVFVLENDLTRRADSRIVEELLKGAKHVVALDCLPSPTTAAAEIVLPAGTFAESDGTFVNNEGRAQRLFQVFVPDDPILESWRWLAKIMVVTGRGEGLGWKNFDDVLDTMGRAIPALAPARDAAPGTAFRMAGGKIPREPHRYSGRTAMLAQINVNEPKPPDDPDSPLSFSMEGTPVEPPGALIPYFWSPGWNSIQATNKFQSEIAGPLKGGDPGVRLIEPVPGAGPAPFGASANEFAPHEGAWLAVPLFHIFGSEELSAWAPAVRELVPERYVALNPEEAHRLGFAEGQELEVAVDGRSVTLPLRTAPALPKGLAGIPAGLPGLPKPQLPAWVEISKPS